MALNISPNGEPSGQPNLTVPSGKRLAKQEGLGPPPRKPPSAKFGAFEARSPKAGKAAPIVEQTSMSAADIDDIANKFSQFTDRFYATGKLQPFFRRMHQLALRGMGIGNGGTVDQSGEAMAMVYVKDQLLRAYPGRALTIFDVGANNGQFLSAALKVFGLERVEYHSFEPSRRAFSQLQSFVSRLGGAVFAHNFGFGDRDETAPLYSDKPGAQIGSLYKRQLENFGIAMKHMEDVKIRTVDGFAQERGIERVHFLKIDTEGHELKCMEGARGLMDAGRIDFIQFEMGCNVDSRTFFRDFWQVLKKYRIGRILRDGIVGIERYQASEEQFGSQNLLAELRVKSR